MTRIKKLIAVCISIIMLLSPFTPSASAQTGQSAVTALTASSVPDGYVRLKNKWQSNYLYEQADGKVLYGFTSITDQTSEWLIEDAPGVSGNVRIKNRATGHYITIAQATTANTPLTSEAITTSTAQDQWIMEQSSRAGYLTFKSVTAPDSGNYIHEEGQKGFAQFGSINPTFESPQWALEPVSDIAPVRILSKVGTGHYLYEDSDGLVKSGNVSASDPRSHWYINPINGSSTIQMRNRASGHFITQNDSAVQPTYSLPMNNAAPTTQQWEMTTNAGWLNFSNVDHLPPAPYFLIAPADFADLTTRSIGADWGRNGNGDDQKWKFEAASDVTPTRIVNFTTESAGSAYLSEDNAGVVKVGPLDAANNAYLWLSEDYNGKKRIKNVATGHYISMKNVVNPTDPLESLDLPTSSTTDQWSIAISTIYDDYKTIQSADNGSNFVNVQPQATHAQSSSVTPDNPNPGQWLFEDPAVVPGATQYVQIQSKWNLLYLYEDASGNLKYGNAKSDDRKSQWLITKYEGRKLIQNRLSGHYLNIETMTNGHIQVSAFSDADLLMMTPLEKNKVKWVVENNGGTVNIHSVKDTNSNIDHQKFIHIQNLTKYAEYGEINRNWTSAQLQFVTVVDAPPASTPAPNIYIKNKETGAYLYEDTSGFVMNGAQSVTNTTYQWTLETSGEFKRIKNVSTGHYINLDPGELPIDAKVDPVKAIEANPQDINQWSILDAGDGNKFIVNHWANTHLYALSATGNLYNDYVHFDTPSSRETTKWILEDAAVPTPVSNILIKNKETGAYLYEDASGFVMNGSLSVTNTTYQWTLEASGEFKRIKNVSTGHYINLDPGDLPIDAKVDPVKAIEANPQDINQWSILDAGDGNKFIVNHWANTHLYALSATGNLYNDYVHFDNTSSRETTKWILEDAPAIPESVIPTGYIQIKNGTKFLYESPTGVVLFGNVDADNGYSNWIIETNNNISRIKNRETGHYFSMNTDYTYIESVSSSNANDLKTQWSVEKSGNRFIIRSLNGKYDDEFINVQNNAGYAERGLYPDTFGSIQWTFIAAPNTTHTPAIVNNRNTKTSTHIFDESNLVTIFNKTTNQYLYESEGKVKYGALDSVNIKPYLWGISDFNGHKIIQNAITGHYLSIEDQQTGIIINSEDYSDLRAQWIIDDYSGYKKISSALPAHDYLYQDASSTYAQHGAFNSNTSLWRFTEFAGGAFYQADKAFISGNVQKSSAMEYIDSSYLDHFTSIGDKVIFAVNSQTDTTSSAWIGFLNPTASVKTLSMYVNGLKIQQLEFLPTDAKTGSYNVLSLPLRAGYNSVSFEFDSGDSGQLAIGSLITDNTALAYRGATQTYITYEAEQATTNGTILEPTRANGEFASEASGRQAVKLTGDNQKIDFNLIEPANSLVLRYSIPDGSNNEDGTTNSLLALYVNDQFIKNIDLTSKFTWEYGNYPWSKDPAEGNARRFYDETHVLFGQNLSAGDTISLRKVDSKQAYIIVDFADMEQAPTSAYSQPDGFLSITDYGAVANDGNDDTPSLEAAIAAAKLQHKGVWIPAGTFEVASGSFNTADGADLDGLILLDNVTIRGAGMWYTTLKGAKFYGYGSNIRVYDLAIDGDLNIRDDAAHTNGFEGAFGPGSTLQNLWIEHTKTGMWITRSKQSINNVDSSLFTNGLYVAGLRIRDTMADGINFSINTKNSMVEETNVRYPGDDGLAMWSTLTSGYPNDYTDNNTFRFNTVQLPWLANNMALFGGKNNKFTDNILMDTINGGSGITVATRFDPTPFGGTTEIARNTLIRTGSRDNGLALNFGAIWVYVDTKPINSSILFKDNIALDSTYQGLSIQGAYSVNKVSINDLVIDGAGLSGIEMSSGVSGTVDVDNVIIRNTKLGDLSNSTVSINELNQGFSSNKKPFSVKIDAITDGPFQMNEKPKVQLQVNLTDELNTDVTSGTTFTILDSQIATVNSNGVIRATGEGTTIIDAMYGSIHRLYTLDVKGTFITTPPSGGTILTPTPSLTQPLTPSLTTAPKTDEQIIKANILENQKKLENALANNQKSIVFEIDADGKGTGANFSINSVLAAMKSNPDLFIIIKSGNATYELPSNLKDIILSSNSSFDLTNSILSVKIDKVDAATNNQITKKATDSGLKLLNIPIDFQITIQSGDKKVEIKNFGNTYVSRTIELDGNMDAKTATAVVFDPITGEFRYIPAIFTAANGNTLVTIKSTTNSIYSIAQFNKSFEDIKTHWAKPEIELLSAKLIVSGKSSNTFAPDDKITRAEFATLLVRALGLTSNGTSTSFKDVNATDWFAKYVQIAAQFKLITGYEDGTFKPNQIITREQMAVMAERALQFSNLKPALASPASTNIQHFADASKISAWAQEAAGQIVANGIIKGKTADLFAPQDSTTRAEATVILTRLLQTMNLINK